MLLHTRVLTLTFDILDLFPFNFNMLHVHDAPEDPDLWGRLSALAEGGATGTGHRVVCMQFTLFHFILVLFLDHHRRHRFARNLSDHDLSSPSLSLGKCHLT